MDVGRITDPQGLSHLERRKYAERKADPGPWLIDCENGICIAPATKEQILAFRRLQRTEEILFIQCGSDYEKGFPTIMVDSASGTLIDADDADPHGDYWACWIDGLQSVTPDEVSYDGTFDEEYLSVA